MTSADSSAGPAPKDFPAWLRAKQRQEWESGRPVRVEEYVRLHPQLQTDDEALLDLIYGEFVLREEQGETPSPGEYESRFPRLAARLTRLFAVDLALKESVAESEPSAFPSGGQ